MQPAEPTTSDAPRLMPHVSRKTRNRRTTQKVFRAEVTTGDGAMAATRNDWKSMPFPTATAVLTIDRRYASTEFERIKQGSVPQEMDDKWFTYYEEPWLYLHRSWTGFGVFRVRFEPTDNGAVVAEAFVSRDSAQYRGTDPGRDALLLSLLLDEYAGRDTQAAWEHYVGIT